MITIPTRPVLRYHGGKWLLAPWILQHFPHHRLYTEAFGGAASVLLQKPRAYHEVYNDLDGEIVNLFRVLRTPGRAAMLRRLCRLTPFSREDFRDAFIPTDDLVERARRLVVRSFLGYGNCAAFGRSTGFRAWCRESGSSPERDWQGWPDEIAAFVERLRGVTIENAPALEVIKRHDGPDTLHYADPPYPHSTRAGGDPRRNGQLYRHEMADRDHGQLAEVLREVSGFVVLSGYACDLYDRDLYADWHRIERETKADGGRARTEVLWLSPRTAEAIGGRQQSIFSEARA